jgi:hypothetical protein
MGPTNCAGRDGKALASQEASVTRGGTYRVKVMLLKASDSLYSDYYRWLVHFQDNPSRYPT